MENTFVGNRVENPGTSGIALNTPQGATPAPLDAALAENQGAIDDLTSALEFLVTRLQPVSRIPADANSDANPVSQQLGSSPAVSALMSRTAQIAGLASIVRAQTQLLEV